MSSDVPVVDVVIAVAADEGLVVVGVIAVVVVDIVVVLGVVVIVVVVVAGATDVLLAMNTETQWQ